MLTVKIICVGRLKERYFLTATEEYIRRLTPYCKVVTVEIPEEPVADTSNAVLLDKALKKEGEQILKAVDEKAYVFALCIEGERLTSPVFAQRISDISLTSSRAIFIIGSSNGLHSDVKNYADCRLSMSSLTFPHNLARVMLLEQVYRSFKINEGGNYHK